MFERALALTRPYRVDIQLEMDLAMLSDPPEAARIADAAAARAEAAGDEKGLLLAHTVATYARTWTGEATADELEQAALAALPLLEAVDDHAGLACVWTTLGDGVANQRARYEEFAQAAERAIRHSRQVGPGDPLLGGLAGALMFGPRPAGEALATLDRFLPEQPAPTLAASRAVLLAMLDRFAEAWAITDLASQRMRELGQAGWPGYFIGAVAELSGNFHKAADGMRQWCAELERIGSTSGLATSAPELGRVLCRLGSYDEAESLARQGRSLAGADDIVSQTQWRQVLSLVLAQRGECDEAERLAHEAVAWSARSDTPRLQADAYCDLAEVLEAAGRRDEAIEAWHEALERYERKGIVPLARRTRERLAALEPV
jgi:tetratricopeptide (TPR) repeat protein